MDPLAGLPVGQFSAGALVGLIVLLILIGRLVPRQQLLDKQAEVDKLWAANDNLMKAHHELGMGLEKLLAYAETTNHAIGEIQDMAKRSIEERQA